MTAVIAISVIFVAFGCAAIGAWLSERTPERPLYDFDDVLPPPNVRSQRYEPSDELRWHL